MDTLERFLKEDQDAMEARRYRSREKELKEIDNIMADVGYSKKKQEQKREEFKNKLAKLGVNIVEKERK